ncbi:HEAT repeat domain-containing protein [Singulisphaera sp. PoT]|uniref:HEAT repeat domain-containing protein n=1 Tax=Singulisphaera sp. PoT TaxID=3411797 RepID=UPI003BF4CEE8
MRIRGVMILVAAAGVALAVGGWAWRAYFSPTHRWLRTVRDPDAGIGRWEKSGRALGGADPWVSPEMAASALIGALQSPRWNVRADAAAVLGHGGKKAEGAIPALIAALHDPEESVRAGALRSLGLIITGGGRGRDEVIPALIGSLRDRAAWVRQTAATELGVIVKPGDREANAVIVPLRSLREDRSPAAKVSACWALTRLGLGRECIPTLLGALDDPEMTVRALAVGTLAELGPGPPEAIKALEARLEAEDNPIILKEVEKALLNLRGEVETPGP